MLCLYKTRRDHGTVIHTYVRHIFKRTAYAYLRNSSLTLHAAAQLAWINFLLFFKWKTLHLVEKKLLTSNFSIRYDSPSTLWTSSMWYVVKQGVRVPVKYYFLQWAVKLNTVSHLYRGAITVVGKTEGCRVDTAPWFCPPYVVFSDRCCFSFSSGPRSLRSWTHCSKRGRVVIVITHNPRAHSGARKITCITGTPDVRVIVYQLLKK